jgi:hypothetical protein
MAILSRTPQAQVKALAALIATTNLAQLESWEEVAVVEQRPRFVEEAEEEARIIP